MLSWMHISDLLTAFGRAVEEVHRADVVELDVDFMVVFGAYRFEFLELGKATHNFG